MIHDATGFWIIFGAVFIIGSSLISKVLEKKAPDRFTFSFPLLLLHDKKSINLIERTADRFETGFSYWGWIGLIVTVLTLISGFFIVILSVLSVVNAPQSATINSPTNYLVIPGVNDFLPLSVGLEILVGLALGMIVHEGGHGILCRIENIDIESTGLVFIGLIVLGAFVEPDEEAEEEASPKSILKMASAGIMNNYALAIIMLLLLIYPLSSIIVVAGGGHVGETFSGSPADKAGLEKGDIITGIENESIESNSDISNYIDNSTKKSVTVSLKSGEQVTVDRQVFASGSTGLIELNSTIVRVNSEEVHTVPEVRQIWTKTEKEFITVTNSSGAEQEIPVAVSFTTKETEEIFVYEVNGERVRTREEAIESVNETSEITVTYVEKTDSSYSKKQQVTLNNSEYVINRGFSGVVLSDTGIKLFPSEFYLSIFDATYSNGGENVFTGEMWQRLLVLFIVPFASLIGLQFDFPGFSSEYSSFYTTSFGPESIMLFIITCLFWTAWININLAIFNALPVYALDGSYIVQSGSELMSEKFGINKNVLLYVERFVLITTLLAILLVIFIPII